MKGELLVHVTYSLEVVPLARTWSIFRSGTSSDVHRLAPCPRRRCNDVVGQGWSDCIGASETFVCNHTINDNVYMQKWKRKRVLLPWAKWCWILLGKFVHTTLLQFTMLCERVPCLCNEYFMFASLLETIVPWSTRSKIPLGIEMVFHWTCLPMCKVYLKSLSRYMRNFECLSETACYI